MSHFSVVIHFRAADKNLVNNEKAIEDILMPWHEYESTGIQNKYVRHVPITEDVLNDYLRTRTVFAAENEDGTKTYQYGWQFKQETLPRRKLTGEEEEAAKKHIYVYKDNEIRMDYTRDKIYVLSAPNNYKKEIIAECYWRSFVEAVEDHGEVSAVIDNMADAPANGSYCYVTPGTEMGPFPIDTDIEWIRDHILKNAIVCDYTNPDAKWDWWSIGGRFGLHTKDNEPCSYCQIKNLRAFNPMSRLNAEKIWNLIMNNHFDGSESEKSAFMICNCWGYTKELLSAYESKEAFIEDYCTYYPYAYIKDGKWYEPGEMGWFGCSNSTAESQLLYNQSFKKMLEECDPEDWLVCVDCHI